MSQELKDQVLIQQWDLWARESKKWWSQCTHLDSLSVQNPRGNWLNGAKAPASVHGQVRLRQPILDIRKDIRKGGWMQTHTPMAIGVSCASVSQLTVWVLRSWAGRLGNCPAQLHDSHFTFAVRICAASSLQKRLKKMRRQRTSWKIRRKQA